MVIHDEMCMCIICVEASRAHAPAPFQPWKAGMPRRSMAPTASRAALSCSTFSASVRRCSRSSTRAASGALGSLQLSETPSRRANLMIVGKLRTIISLTNRLPAFSCLRQQYKLCECVLLLYFYL